MSTHLLTDEECRLLGLEKEHMPVAQSVPAPVSSEFIEPSWYKPLSYAMLSPNERGCTIFGPRGTGKSTAIRELAISTNHTYVTMQCAKNMQLDALLGTVGLSGGSTTFVDGPLTTAVRNGYWLLAEEANTVDPGIWSAVNTLIDKTGEGLRLPTGEVIPNHPDFRLVLLYNEGYSGTREVNAALKDRLMPILTEYPSVTVEGQMLQGSMPHLSTNQVMRLINCASMIRAANLDFDLSIRAICRWAGLHAAGIGTWTECYKVAVMDLAGDPKIAAPKRAVLAEIAANCGMDKW